MRIVDSDKRPKVDAIRPWAIDDKRREKMSRWAFWMFFLLATLCAFAWKMAYASTA